MTHLSRGVQFATLGLLVLSTQSAHADAIDGNWCSDGGRRLSIVGPTVVTPGGAQLEGSYSRHSFIYTAPATEPDGGQEVTMRLLNDTAVQIQFGSGTAKIQTWHRCTATTS